MIAEILINAGLRRTRIALMADGRLVELLSDRDDGEPRVGDIHFARITRRAPEIDGSFVDLGDGRSGLLRDRDGGAGLSEGTGVIVQIRRETVDGKDARVTARLRLPGRLLVLLPDGGDCSVSARIGDPGRRAALLEQVRALAGSDGAFVARTLSEMSSAADLDTEAKSLRATWAMIDASARERSTPGRLHHDDIIAAALRDNLNAEVARIVVDGFDGSARVRTFCERHAPFALDRIETCSPGTQAFDRHDAAAQVAAALIPRVDLPSGGAIVIESTQALTAIDVNAGSTSGSATEVWRRTNLEAATEIARQIRLRDIAGNIVVDFIRMQGAGDGEQVLRALRSAVAGDRVDVRVSSFSEFGLVEVTRQRDRTPLAQRLTRPCATCHGSSRRLALAELADDLIDRALAEAYGSRGGAVVAIAAPALIDELGGAAGPIVQALYDRAGCRLDLRADPARAVEDYEVQAT